MARFVVLLRGVNVGKGNRIAMADFRCLLEAAGFSEVRTLLNSGNAVFASAGRAAAARHAEAIAKRLQHEHGLSVPVVVVSARSFATIIAECPMVPPEAEHSTFLVAFPQRADALAGLAELKPLAEPPERFEIGRHAAYLHCARGILHSALGSALLGKAGRAVTTRNWATVLKIDALLRAGPA